MNDVFKRSFIFCWHCPIALLLQLIHDRPHVVQRVFVAKVSAFPGCLTNRLNDFLVGMPQPQCPVSHEKVDGLVTVDVPLAASTAALDVERHRFAVAKVVADSTRKNITGTLLLRRAPGTLRCVRCDQFIVCCHRLHAFRWCYPANSLRTSPTPPPIAQSSRVTAERRLPATTQLCGRYLAGSVTLK